MNSPFFSVNLSLQIILDSECLSAPGLCAEALNLFGNVSSIAVRQQVEDEIYENCSQS